jgi:hypothetical protein
MRSVTAVTKAFFLGTYYSRNTCILHHIGGILDDIIFRRLQRVPSVQVQQCG